ncbi:hypothetical protein Tco_0541362 [Tanacetum coccineum]
MSDDECIKLLTNKVDLYNPEGHQIQRNVYEPLPLGGPPGQRERERRIALSISKLKAARYLDFGLEEPFVEFDLLPWSKAFEAVREEKAKETMNMRITSLAAIENRVADRVIDDGQKMENIDGSKREDDDMCLSRSQDKAYGLEKE